MSSRIWNSTALSLIAALAPIVTAALYTQYPFWFAIESPRSQIYAYLVIAIAIAVGMICLLANPKIEGILKLLFGILYIPVNLLVAFFTAIFVSCANGNCI